LKDYEKGFYNIVLPLKHSQYSCKMLFCFQFFIHIGYNTSKKKQDFCQLSDHMKKYCPKRGPQAPGMTRGCRMTYNTVAQQTAAWAVPQDRFVTHAGRDGVGLPGGSGALRELNLNWAVCN